MTAHEPCEIAEIFDLAIQYVQLAPRCINGLEPIGTERISRRFCNRCFARYMLATDLPTKMAYLPRRVENVTEENTPAFNNTFFVCLANNTKERDVK